MNLTQAMQLASDGHKLRRTKWPIGKYMFASDGRFFVTDGGSDKERYTIAPIKPTTEGARPVPHPDKDANDWYVYTKLVTRKESEKEPSWYEEQQEAAKEELRPPPKTEPKPPKKEVKPPVVNKKRGGPKK